MTPMTMCVVCASGIAIWGQELDLKQLDDSSEKHVQLYCKSKLECVPKEKKDKYKKQEDFYAYLHVFTLITFMELDEELAVKCGLDINDEPSVDDKEYIQKWQQYMDKSWCDLWINNSKACRMSCPWCPWYVNS